MIDSQQIETAYRKLKQLAYHDRTDLRLRKRIAHFESSPSIEERFLALARMLNLEDPNTSVAFRQWLIDIDFRLVPKGLRSASRTGAESGGFFSNVTTSREYEVEKLHFFFDGPVELHLIAVLWLLQEGHLLDQSLGAHCYGGRLATIEDFGQDTSTRLFRPYHELYSEWRDAGIKRAQRVLSEGANVSMLSLDIKDYFYNIQLDFEKLSEWLNVIGANAKSGAAVSVGKRSNKSVLTWLREIHLGYQHKVRHCLRLARGEEVNVESVLPIGLCTSPLLANWYLKDFDRLIHDHLNPVYYGRYIDDIFLVLSNPDVPDEFSDDTSAVNAILERNLVTRGVLKSESKNSYSLGGMPQLLLQTEKCCVQYLDASHSIAGLEKFKQQLEESSSDFLLLPAEEADASLGEIAYELIYDGSQFKFRNFKGVSENRFALAKYLVKQTMFYLIVQAPPNHDICKELRTFFKGRNAIQYFDLWERVLTYFLVSNAPEHYKLFLRELEGEIAKTRYMTDSIWTKDNSLSGLLRENLLAHLEDSKAIVQCLGEVESLTTSADVRALRDSNMLRHHFVKVPLLNYTEYLGSLIESVATTRPLVSKHKVKFSPRYVNFDECVLHVQWANPDEKFRSHFDVASQLYSDFNNVPMEGMRWVEEKPNKRK